MRPLTDTRPAVIQVSRTRREASPARARTFCSRSVGWVFGDGVWLDRETLGTRGGLDDLDFTGIFVLVQGLLVGHGHLGFVI